MFRYEYLSTIGALMACFEVGDRAPHENAVLPLGVFYTNGVGILPAECTGDDVAGRELDFYSLLVANEGLDLANTGQAGIESVRRHVKMLGVKECVTEVLSI